MLHVEIPIRGGVTTVSARDLKWFAPSYYQPWRIDNLGRVVRSERDRNILLSRRIMRAPKGMVVDHIDHDLLNNTRENLRVCTQAQNVRNRKSVRVYKGVQQTQGRSYKAELWINRVYHVRGPFTTPEEAASAYDKMALELHGEFARLNFPEICDV